MSSNGCKGIGMMKRSVSFSGMAAAWMTLIGVLLLVPPARAQEGNSHMGSVVQGTGSFTTQVSISVPPYHGIEPKLALGYSSTLQNGFVGIGWSLGGFSSVVRGGPRNTLPSYDGTDIFYLNGIELIPCDPSPCATFGGTHRPKYENYHRIAYEPANDRWVVTQKNGTKGIYERLVVYTDDSARSSTYSWGLRMVVDVYDNTVTYNYVCPPMPSSAPETIDNRNTHAGCYVESITYLDNGVADAVRVTFYKEERPDPVINAIGGRPGHHGAFVGTFFRLKSIDVQMNLSESGTADWRRIRTYYLTYDRSSETGHSILTNIQQFGSDAVLDGSGGGGWGGGSDRDRRYPGDVTSGSALPPMEYEWQEPVNRLSAVQHLEAPPEQEYSLIGDVNGDGRADYLYQTKYPLHLPLASLRVRLSNGQTWNDLPAHWGTITSWLGGFGDAHWLTDVTGDGCDDFVFRTRLSEDPRREDRPDLYLMPALPAPSGQGCEGFASQPQMPTFVLDNLPAQSQPLGRQLEAVADFNGDGKSDYFYEPPRPGQTPIDFNPNGNGELRVVLARSDGTGFDSDVVWGLRTDHQVHYNATLGIYSQWFVDVNGDGLTDYVYKRHELVNRNTGEPCDPSVQNNNCIDASDEIYAMLSTGSGFDGPQLWHTTERPVAPGVSAEQFADFNGDGRADYLYHGYHPNGQYAGDLWVALSNGSSFVEARLWGKRTTPSADPESRYLLDFNSDGLVDYLYLRIISRTFTVPRDNCPRPQFCNPIYYVELTPEFRVLKSTGHDFSSDAAWTTLTGFDPVVVPRIQLGQYAHLLRPVDITGDGLPDLVHDIVPTNVNIDTPYHTFIYSSGSLDPGGEGPNKRLVVERILSGHGLTTDIAYAFRYGKGLDYETVSGADTFYRDFTRHFLPLGVVRRLTTSDAVTANSLTTLYDYSNLIYSYDERTLLGFEEATQTINDDGSYNPTTGAFDIPQPYSETRFNVDESDLACVGQTLRALVRSGSGGIYSAQANEFVARSASPPYECIPTVQESYECERFASDPANLSACRLTRSRNDIDAVDEFGHPRVVYEYGEVCADPRCGEDDKIVEVDFAHNAQGSRFLVGFPVEERVYAAQGETRGALLQHTRMYYDQKPALGVLGTLGQLSQKRVWNDSAKPGESEWLVTYNAYDEVGNLVFSQDPLGRRTWTVYDDVYRMFAVRTCNPRVSAENSILKHSECTPEVANTQREWDFLDGDTPFGVEISLTDWNGRRTESEYDIFGRLVRTRGPERDPGTGELLVGADTIYQIDTVPNYTITCSYPAGTLNAAPCQEGANQLESISFMDGWGHGIQSKQKAEDGRSIVSHVELDRMGRTVVSYNPFFEPEGTFEQFTASVPAGLGVTRSFYDEAGRIVRSEMPSEGGGTSVYTTAYPAPDSSESDLRAASAIGCVTARDARGNATTSCKDGLGRTVTIEEDTGPGATTVTKYAYDTLGRLLSIRTAADTPKEVEITTSYDSLGRQLSMTDPNMGPILYEYDAAGNVTKKIESDGTTTRFDYDILDRLVRKCATPGTGADEVGLKKVAGRVPEPALSEYDQGDCEVGEVEIASYEYDDASLPNSAGRLSAMRDLSGRTEYGYDERGRISLLRKSVDCDASGALYGSCVQMSVVRDYDLAGRLTRLVYPDTESVVYEYQKRGLLSRVRSASSGHDYATGFNYNVAGEVTEVVNGNGVVSRRFYDPATLRLTSIATDSYAQNHTGLAPDGLMTSGGYAGGAADVADDPDAPDGNWLTDAGATREMDVAPNRLRDRRFFTGNLSDVADDPDEPDGNWLNYQRGAFDRDAEAGFEFASPPGEILATGAGLQRIRMLVRRREQTPTASATPQCSMALLSDRQIVLQGTPQSVPDGESILTLSWDAAVLGGADALGVGVFVVCSPATDSNGESTAADIGAVEWRAAVYNEPALTASFPTPANDLYYGEGLQEFRALLRQSNPIGAQSPSATLELWEGGVKLLAGPTVSVPASGTVVSFGWDAGVLSDPTGANVELKIIPTQVGAVASDRNTIEIGAVRWVADQGSGVLQRLRYTYDPNGNVTVIEDLRRGMPDQQFEYDAMNRLAGATEAGGYGYRGYRYDDLGNITKKCFDPACAAADEYDYASSGLPHAVGTLTHRDGTPDLGELTYGAAYDARGNMNLRTVVKVGSGGPTATDYRLKWGYDNRLHTVIEDPAGAADPLARYVYDGHGARAVRYAQGAPTFYLGPWFELRLKDGKSVKRIPGTGALVSCSASRAQFLAAGTLTKLLRRYLQRSWQELTNPGLNFPAHQMAVARLYLALLVLLVLIELQAAQRMTRGLLRRLQKVRGGVEVARDLKAALIARRAWKEFAPLEGPWTATRSFAALCATALLVSSLSGCGENPYGSARDLVTGRSAASGSPPAAAALSYVFADHLGGVNVVTDQLGNFVERKDYLPFGEKDPTGVPPESQQSDEDRGFAGTRDEPGDLQGMGNRFYDPLIGRFTSADPVQVEVAPLLGMRLMELGFQANASDPGANTKKGVRAWQNRVLDPQDLNRFSYVQNNPVNVIDVGGYSGRAVRAAFWRWWQKKQAGPLWKRILTAIAVTIVAIVTAIIGGIFVVGGTLGALAGEAGALGGLAFGAALFSGSIGAIQSAWTAFAQGASPGQIVQAAGQSLGFVVATTAAILVVQWAFNQIQNIFSSGSVDAVNDVVLSQAVYDHSIQEGQAVPGHPDLTLVKRFDDPSIGFGAGLYETPSGYTLAFEGTNGLALENWRANLSQAFGFGSPQHTRAIELATQLSQQYPNLHFTGHSLGGGLAAAAAVATHGRANIFNAAALHPNTVGGIPFSNATITHYYSSTDVLQLFNLLTPSASVPGAQVPLGAAGFHGIGGVCAAAGC